jgi:DNA-binding NarL/FixJ family response regulator
MAETITKVLFPGKDRLLQLPMEQFSGESPYAAEFATHRLLGPPPPYVGWEKGGLLTNHVLQHPSSVVVLDEFEKASTDVKNIFLTIFDTGETLDGRGRIVSFRDVYFILTSNAAEELHRSRPKDVREERVRELIRREGAIEDSLLNRIHRVILFRYLSQDALSQLAKRMLKALQKQMLEEKDRELILDEEELSWYLAAQCVGAQGKQEPFGLGGKQLTGPPNYRQLERVFTARIVDPLEAKGREWQPEWERVASIELKLKRVNGDERIEALAHLITAKILVIARKEELEPLRRTFPQYRWMHAHNLSKLLTYAEPPNLILVDMDDVHLDELELDGVYGAEALADLWKASPDLTLALMTADQAEPKVKLTFGGADYDCFRKPLEPSLFIEFVDALLEEEKVRLQRDRFLKLVEIYNASSREERDFEIKAEALRREHGSE